MGEGGVRWGHRACSSESGNGSSDRIFLSSLKQHVPRMKIIGTQLFLSGVPEVMTRLRPLFLPAAGHTVVGQFF